MRNAFTRRRVAAGLAAAATVSMVLCTGTAAHANTGAAVAPNGGVYNPFLEKNGATFDPTNAVPAGGSGLWGHEGTGGAIGETDFSGDMTDGGTAIANAFQVSDPTTQVGLAFVATSADGSAERPTYSPGTTGVLAGQAFQYFTSTGFAGSANGDTVGDGVLMLSTQAQYNAWIAGGKPDEIFNPNGNLTLVDPLNGNAASGSHSKGSSILNTWPAGTHVSMVYFAIDGYSADNEPIVKLDSSGHAITAWTPFTTVASSTRTVATSAGYHLDAAPLTATTTTLDPITGAQAGSPVTMTAHVSPATAGETVTFAEGSTTLGTGTTNASGTATYTTSSLATGTHSITASFAGDATHNGSTSSAQSVTITAVPAVVTTTALSVPATGTEGQVYNLLATVSAANSTHPAGTVQFKDAGVNVGSPITVSTTDGTATLPWTATGGGHNFTATFTPATGQNYTSSTSSAQAMDVAYTRPVSTDQQTITADVDAGTILVSTPYTSTNPLNVGLLSLNPTSTAYTGTAAFKDIIVTDTRSGGLAWDLTAVAGNLTSGSNVINGENVGLTGLTTESTLIGGAAAVQTGTGAVTTTDHAAANAVSATDGGTLGLKNPGAIMHRAAPGTGTVTYGGTLSIIAPTSTNAGHYTGTVTFTVS